MNSVDRVVGEMEDAMAGLKRSLSGIPVRRDGFRSDHKTLAHAVATLHTELRYARLRAADN